MVVCMFRCVNDVNGVINQNTHVYIVLGSAVRRLGSAPRIRSRSLEPSVARWTVWLSSVRVVCCVLEY